MEIAEEEKTALVVGDAPGCGCANDFDLWIILTEELQRTNCDAIANRN